MITDQLKPNLMFPDGQVPLTVGRLPFTGDGSQLVERPWVYVYDATGLTDGTSPLNNRFPLDPDGDFWLRRLVGLDTVATGGIRLRQPTGRYYGDSLIQYPPNWAFANEIGYTANSEIQFDLGTVARSSIGCGGNPIYTSYLCFQGVKTLMGGGRYETPYNYKRLPYTFTYAPLTIDWYHYTTAPTQDALHQFYQDIDDYDFELHQILVSYYGTGGSRGVNGTQDAVGYWQIQLYDYAGNPTSNAPVPVNYLQSLHPTLNGVFPVPALLYPANSQIRFDVRSMICPLDAAFPKLYQVQFVGMQRYPR